MQLYSLLSSVLVILFWINGRRAECLSSQNGESEQFTIYKQCIQKYSIPAWTLLGPAYNESFYTAQTNRLDLMYEKPLPIAIIMPTKVQHVQAAVRCGVQTNILLVPRSGGHSYAGLSYGSNDSIIIDFQNMNEVSVDRENLILTAGPGALLAKVYGTLWKNGKLGAPLGLCATVAIGGFVLSGGVGYFSGLYGLAADNILEIQMVDVRGNVVLVDPNNNQDLFWALRGLGPGYIGLVTSVKMRVFKTEDIKLTLVLIYYDLGSFKNVMESYSRWLDWTEENEPSIASVISITKTGGIIIEIFQFIHRYIELTGNPAFPDILPSYFPEPVKYEVNHPTFTEFVLLNNLTNVRPDQRIPHDDIDRLELLATITKDKAIPYYLYLKGFFVKKRYTAEDLEQAHKVLVEMPDGCAIWINFELGVTPHRRPKYASAYDVHRDARFYLKGGLWSNEAHLKEAGVAWTHRFYESLNVLNSGETYQGNPEKNLTDYLHRYYGSNLDRLIEVKRKWDPNGYFNTEQSIPVS